MEDEAFYLRVEMLLNGTCSRQRWLTLTVGLTFLLMLISSFYHIEMRYQRYPVLPCVYRILEIPQTGTSYGFPVFWLTHVEGIKQVGCGPVVGTLSTYAFALEGFLTNLTFYSLATSLVVFLMNSRRNDAPQTIILQKGKLSKGDRMGKDERKGKAEEVAEKTGEAVGKGVKKGWGITKGIGKGLMKGVKGDKKEKKK